jgi:acylphosphatase
VQGVGFRYTVQNLALQYNLVGYVRNLSDGRVELVMEGPQSEMSYLLDDIRHKMGDYISEVEVEEGEPTGCFCRFCIKH